MDLNEIEEVTEIELDEDAEHTYDVPEKSPQQQPEPLPQEVENA